MSTEAARGDEDPRVTRTREVVHAAVLRLLETDGPAGVTHARVVEESPVSRATLYRHWPDRTALLVDAIGSERPRFGIGEPTGDLRVDLRELLRAGARMMTQTKTMPWLVALSVRAIDDPDLRIVLERVAEMHDTPLRPLFDRAVEEGTLRPGIDRNIFESMCFGTLFTLRFLWQQDLTDELVDSVVETILLGVAAPST